MKQKDEHKEGNEHKGSTTKNVSGDLIVEKNLIVKGQLYNENISRDGILFNYRKLQQLEERLSILELQNMDDRISKLEFHSNKSRRLDLLEADLAPKIKYYEAGTVSEIYNLL